MTTTEELIAQRAARLAKQISADKAARRRKRIERIITSIISDVLMLLLSALWLMLLVGDVHRDWLPHVASISYGFSVLLSALSGASHDRDKGSKS